MLLTCLFQNDVAINALAKKDNKYPHIIAVGENEKDISRYFINVDRHLIDVRIVLIYKFVFTIVRKLKNI